MKRHQEEQEHLSHLSILKAAVRELHHNWYTPVVTLLAKNEITSYIITHLTSKIPDVSILNC